MKLITCNIWCGIKYEQLQAFLKRQALDTDIFCFQEVRNGEYHNPNSVSEEIAELFSQLQTILPEFKGYFTEMVPGVGIASFVRNNISVDRIESTQILSAQDLDGLKMPDGSSYYPRMLQSVYLKDKNLTIQNFHGVPGNLKKDTPARNMQTDNLLKIINSNNDSQILVGDFNLDINTEAVARLGERMNNLIKGSGFKATRNANYSKFETLPFADYIFTTPEIEVQEFLVLPDEVSDHLPLSLKFNL